jgi:hypothetical protein
MGAEGGRSAAKVVAVTAALMAPNTFPPLVLTRHAIPCAWYAVEGARPVSVQGEALQEILIAVAQVIGLAANLISRDATVPSTAITSFHATRMLLAVNGVKVMTGELGATKAIFVTSFDFGLSLLPTSYAVMVKKYRWSTVRVGNVNVVEITFPKVAVGVP